jgi:NADH-ubiquinone oxidoreductase chain 4
MAVILGSLTTLRQIDMKKIIAYSSIVHMNFALLGLFSLSLPGIVGSIILMISHGFVSGGLFLSVGVLYDRYHSRLLKYLGGFNYFMPLFSIIFLILTLGNISFPGTISFIGELLIIIGIFTKNLLLTV